MTALTAFAASGWYEITSEGIGTIYLAIIDEGMTTGPGDTPANVQFKPRILNPESFSIKRAPQCWVWGTESIQGAAFGTLEIDNYDGAYNFLIENDVRDSVVVIKILPASALLTGTAMSSATVVATAIIDNVTSDNQDHITVSLKDTIARLDRVLPVRYEPPFVDDGAANNMVPLTFGACRNVKPLLVDSPNRLFALHDAVVPNVTLVADKAAPLDPHASPPQYIPALNGAGIQLETMPVGVLTVDCSSYGTQSIIPGADDVMAYSGGTYGDFPDPWSGSPAVPDGWTFSNAAGSTLTKVTDIFGSGSNGAYIITSTVWDGSVNFGDYLERASCLRGGYSYRLNLSVFGITGQPSIDKTMEAGIIIASALTNNAADYIAGYKSPIRGIFTNTIQVAQNLSFEFTVPPGATRNLYLIVTTSTGNTPGQPNGTASAIFYSGTLEELGHYQELPLSGIPYDNFLTEVLVKRAGESASVFNSAEAAAVTTRADGSLIPFGLHYDSPPNILDMIRTPLDSRRYVTFTDNLGVLRFRQFLDPTDPSLTVLCNFDSTNIEPPNKTPFTIAADRATGLTTLYGSRPNQYVFQTASDFVTDQSIVPQNIKTRFSRKSQFQVTSSASPAGEYSHAIGASIFDTCLDEPDDVQDIADDTVGIFSPKVYSDATFTSGKRRQITFGAKYDDEAHVGATVQCTLAQIMFGEIIQFTFDNADGSEHFVDQRAEIISWTVFPFAKRIELTVEL